MYKNIRNYFLAALLFLPLAVGAQNSSINTFSPYTFYGLGDIETQGTAASRSMGGVGIAYWSHSETNVLNPAAYSAAMKNSFLLSIGMAGKQSYLKSSSAKTADNGFNMSDVTLQVPIYKGIGVGASVTPLTTVGYRIHRMETDPGLLTDVGSIKYTYRGEGGITQFKAGIGVQVYQGLSLGADFIYYLGTITRYFGNEITPITSNDAYSNITIRTQEEISKVLFGVGLQYDIIRKPEKLLTVGATFQPKTKFTGKNISETASSRTSDSISYSETRWPITLPSKYGAGVYYRTEKLGIGLDYTYQDWGSSFGLSESEEMNMTLRAMQSFNFGVQYTPNRLDVRSRFKRWTYRAGFRYVDTYLESNGKGISDMALTLGIGMPMKMASFSYVNLGLEIGQRGTTSRGLVRENYFKVFLGISLFGDDGWFVKRKYN